MARGSHAPFKFPKGWIQWAICRQLSQWMPSLGRAFNFPWKTSFAGDFANVVLEDEEHALSFTPTNLEQVQDVLLSARANDAGDTSTYATGSTKLRSLICRIDHCVVTGHKMMVLDSSGASILNPLTGSETLIEIKPSLLKRRDAPQGTFYTLTCNGHFHDFFVNDIIPLMDCLHRHGSNIGSLHIVTQSGFPPFIQQTLLAICSQFKSVEILELRKSERLVDVNALWLSRYPNAREWTPVTRTEADDLGSLLGAYHELPLAAAPDRRLFVSRGDAKVRRLINEAELMAELLDFDFELFLPKSDDHKSQIEAFRSASIIVGVHGAALTNLLFCQPGALVIELFPSDHIKSTYCWLATRLGLRYRAMVGFSGDNMQAFAARIPLIIAELEAELENQANGAQEHTD